MGPKKKIVTRPQKSGFPSKLRLWIAANRDAYEAGRGILGPRNGRQLAKALTAEGENAGDNTVRAWIKAQSLPESPYVGIIERMMQAPWAYLDDPRTPWPPSEADLVIFKLVLTGTASQRAEAADALRRAARART